MLKWFWVSVVVVVVDQVSKYIIASQFAVHEFVTTFIPLIRFQYSQNRYAAFSTQIPYLSDSAQRLVFSAIAFIVIVAIIVWVIRLPRSEFCKAASLTLILGGAIGNLIDRLQYGYVIDFIQLYYNEPLWPTFNVADSAISLGAVLLIMDAIAEMRRQHRADSVD